MRIYIIHSGITHYRLYYVRDRMHRLTLEIALGAKIADGQPQYGQSVQFGQYVVFERQQVGQRVQLGVQPFPVPFAGVTFAHAPVFGCRLHAKIILHFRT